MGDMSLYLINVGLSTDDVMSGRAGDISWPDSVVNLCRGLLGTPHHGLPPKIVKMVLDSAGAERIKERRVVHFLRAILSPHRNDSQVRIGLSHIATSRMRMSCRVCSMKLSLRTIWNMRKFGEVTWLPSSVFWYVVLWCTSATLLSNRSIISLLYHSPISLPSNTNTGTVCAQDKVPNFRFPRVFERTCSLRNPPPPQSRRFHFP